MKETRFIIRSNFDRDGITNEIIKCIEKKSNLAFGIVYDWNSGSESEKNGIIYKRARPLFAHDCKELNGDMLPLDGDILQKMLPYKSLAMEVMKRETHYDIYDRKYLEEVYYKQVKYWNTVIEQNRINNIIFMVSPHQCGDYILYALARIKDINMVIVYPQLMNRGNGSLLGKSLESIGASIEKKYSEIKNNVSVNDYMMGIYNNAKTDRVMSYKSPKQMQQATKKMFLSTTGNQIIFKDVKRLMKIKLNILKMNDKKGSLDYYKRLLNARLKARKYERKMDHLDTYEKLCEKPRENERYIYFPLQMDPESSLIPLAGVYKNQEIAIEMLAYYSEKYNYKIYVKEHYVQVNRSSGYYEKLSKINNVRLIDMKENSLDLIRGAIAVASQTGNCMLEALINKIPAIAFGKGYTFKGAPNIIEVMSLDDLGAALKIIDNGFNQYGEDEIKRYLFAIQKEMIYSYVDSLEETYKEYNKKESAKKIVEYLCNN
ncbi:MAG: hypothetical protein E7275_04875 [Pseudobutyrivibrio sp.]|jgi:hypothetical protein|uniref:hypothetical protein n=1 Tax=Pseudobutyrivibrio sp. TaxID=2014367 RepID=UPI0025F29344|nr:hypothetical protein [Pseudobutyrivibrio sp.]MBE5903601.1 hypothetical protein [Pseudobutyrivibrio sp.]